MSLVEKARLFAIKAHGDQKYGTYPYEYHLQNVVNIIEQYRPVEEEFLPTVLQVAWLHDTIEDTSITFKDIFNEFGRVVARLVLACTNEPGSNRKERHLRTYPKLMAAGRDAIAVKLSDRIANVRHSVRYNHSMLSMYQVEYPEFKQALHLPGELKGLWAELDVLMNYSLEKPKEKKDE